MTQKSSARHFTFQQNSRWEIDPSQIQSESLCLSIATFKAHRKAPRRRYPNDLWLCWLLLLVVALPASGDYRYCE